MESRSCGIRIGINPHKSDINFCQFHHYDPRRGGQNGDERKYMKIYRRDMERENFEEDRREQVIRSNSYQINFGAKIIT